MLQKFVIKTQIERQDYHKKVRTPRENRDNSMLDTHEVTGSSPVSPILTTSESAWIHNTILRACRQSVPARLFIEAR